MLKLSKPIKKSTALPDEGFSLMAVEAMSIMTWIDDRVTDWTAEQRRIVVNQIDKMVTRKDYSRSVFYDLVAMLGIEDVLTGSEREEMLRYSL
jgi:hypothetical protein